MFLDNPYLGFTIRVGGCISYVPSEDIISKQKMVSLGFIFQHEDGESESFFISGEDIFPEKNSIMGSQAAQLV